MAMTPDSTPAGEPARPTLVAADVRVSFGGIVAVDGVSITTAAGEIMGLVGPNGAGKTTFLNAISGLVPMTGRVEVDGRLVSDLPLHRHVEAGIGRAFQNVELLPSLSVIENILLGAHHRLRYSLAPASAFLGRVRRVELRAREEADEIIEFFELERWRDRPVASLSYGRQKLIGVARAHPARPRVLLLDEVGSGLNREEKEDLARFILRLKAFGDVAMVWIEHDIGMVRELADRVTVLEYGRQLASGEPAEVLRLDEVRRAFTGELAEAAS
jgi:branched-chain amino acid transport system ATP-binding protein